MTWKGSSLMVPGTSMRGKKKKRGLIERIVYLLCDLGILEMAPKIDIPIEDTPPPPERKWNQCCVCRKDLSVLRFHEYDFIQVGGERKPLCPDCVRRIKEG